MSRILCLIGYDKIPDGSQKFRYLKKVKVEVFLLFWGSSNCENLLTYILWRLLLVITIIELSVLSEHILRLSSLSCDL